jgi:hypothetical protein
VFAYIVDGSPEELQSALDITLRRFAEYHDLQGAFGRRAQTERAKGILMERYQWTSDRISRRCAIMRATAGRSSCTAPKPFSTGICCCRPRPALPRTAGLQVDAGIGRGTNMDLGSAGCDTSRKRGQHPPRGYRGLQQLRLARLR